MFVCHFLNALQIGFCVQANNRIPSGTLGPKSIAPQPSTLNQTIP